MLGPLSWRRNVQQWSLYLDMQAKLYCEGMRERRLRWGLRHLLEPLHLRHLGEVHLHPMVHDRGARVRSQRMWGRMWNLQ